MIRELWQRPAETQVMEMTPEVQGQGTHLWRLECKADVQMLGLKDRNSSLIHSLTIYGVFIMCQAADEALEICS